MAVDFASCRSAGPRRAEATRLRRGPAHRRESPSFRSCCAGPDSGGGLSSRWIIRRTGLLRGPSRSAGASARHDINGGCPGRSGLAFLWLRLILNRRFIHGPVTTGGEYGSTEEATSSTETKSSKSIVRRKARKPSKSARKRPVKRTVAKATPRKRTAKAKPKGGAKKTRKKVRAVKRARAPTVETLVVDVVEEPIPGVAVVTEIEATEVREAGAEPDEPEGGSAPRESAITIASPACGGR